MDPSHRELLAHPAVTGVLFYPRTIRPSEVPALPSGEILRIPVGGDALGAYWLHSRDDAPTVLFFHGNGEVMTDYLDGFHGSVAALGVNFLVVDYRGYGLSTGHPDLPALLEDARAAWEFVTGPLGLPPGRVVIMGRSLGSLAALEAASAGGRRAGGLVLESGIAEFGAFVDRMGFALQAQGVDLEALEAALADRFDQKAKLGRFEGPVLVLHAPWDEIVPVRNAHRFAAWGDPARTTLHLFPRGGHNDIHAVNEAEYFEVLGGFLKGLRAGS